MLNIKNVKVLIPLCIFSFFIIACSSQNITKNRKPAHSIEELEEQLSHVLTDMHVPGMSIAIVHRKGPEWIAGLGIADLASDRAATEATLFRIGSISKGFVSLAILKLVDEGKLSLEDSLQKLAREVWFDNPWEKTDPVRIAHLLENTTGWDDMHLRELVKNPSTMTSLDALDYDHSSRISRWPPGTRMAYCNSGPAVAAYIVEKITGKNFEEYVQQNFFKPIGMETATYFQPSSELTATLYQSDSITPHPYWHLLYRSIGSINASAKDMASYLLFCLNRGTIYGTQIIPATLFDRMEVPSSTWAAKEGLQVGYGLGNYCTIHEGFIYHGHEGNVPGGLTAMAYLASEGIGYFYSLNSDNREAFMKVGECIRAYITKNLQKPILTPTVLLTEKTKAYAGWYEPSSPRMDLFYFLERLIGIAYVHFDDNTLFLTSLSEKNAAFLPVSETLFRYVPKNKPPDPLPTLKLLTPKPEGQFIQLGLGHSTLKRLPTWLGLFEIFITGFVLLTFMSTLVYAPFWIFGALFKKHRNPAEISMQLLPLIGVLSCLSFIVICMLSKDAVLLRFGTLTVWSFSLFLATIVFAAASLFSVIVLWRAPKGAVRSITRTYATIVTLALVISTVYLAYFGIIGLRTWA